MGRKKKKRPKALFARREVKLTREQAKDFLRITHEDISFLRSRGRTPTRRDVRFASSVLRRLLYEGTYSLAWDLAGFGGLPEFEAVDLEAALAEVPPPFIHYAYAGGADIDGAEHCGYMLLVVPKEEVGVDGPEATAQRVKELFKPGQMRTFPLPVFCLSPSVISGSGKVSRLDVVRYVANKLGGVHWDKNRKAWTDPEGGKNRLLDENHMVGDLPAPLYEVLSIGAAVATSPDTQRLLDRISEIAPVEERARNVISFREGRQGPYAAMTFTPKDGG